MRFGIIPFNDEQHSDFRLPFNHAGIGVKFVSVFFTCYTELVYITNLVDIAQLDHSFDVKFRMIAF